MPRYRILYADDFVSDFRALDAFDRPKVRMAALNLADQAELPSRNRRPLRAPVRWCTEATWQIRVGGHRVLYRVEAGAVYVLRVRFKGPRTTEEMGS